MKETFLTKISLCLALVFSGSLAADAGLEYKIKAGYLYNFTKFITWPETKSPTFNLCLLGNDPFGSVIEPIEKKSAFDRPIKLIRLSEAALLAATNWNAECHILYLNSFNKQKAVFTKIQANPNKAGILVVGEGDGFAADGGMIGFVNRDGRIKLQINPQSVKQTDLKVSAKLLEIAELIKEGKHD
jgi:hypothetical protein